MKLKIIGHEVSADSPVFGKTLSIQPDIDTTPLSTLELIGTMPPKFRATLSQARRETRAGPCYRAAVAFEW